jgi:putative transposase
LLNLLKEQTDAKEPFYRSADHRNDQRTGSRDADGGGVPQQNAFIESFNGSLRDELLNEEMFDSLEDAPRKLALWRYDYNNVRPHSSLGNQTPAEARRAPSPQIA